MSSSPATHIRNAVHYIPACFAAQNSTIRSTGIIHAPQQPRRSRSILISIYSSSRLQPVVLCTCGRGVPFLQSAWNSTQPRQLLKLPSVQKCNKLSIVFLRLSQSTIRIGSTFYILQFLLRVFKPTTNMCKAYVIRFSCSHGLLMSLDVCSSGPCPMIKPTSKCLPQQPYRCWNCQCKSSVSFSSTAESSRSSSCSSSFSSLSSASSLSSVSSKRSCTPASAFSTNKPSPFPTAANRQPSYQTSQASSKVQKPFSFACSYIHAPAPHYTALSHFLPHQDHDCPPCQLEFQRAKSQSQVASECRSTWPLVQEQRKQEVRGVGDWEGPEALTRYVQSQQQEEKEMWYFVSKKWVQDLKAARVLMNEEDGLGLIG